MAIPIPPERSKEQCGSYSEKARGTSIVEFVSRVGGVQEKVKLVAVSLRTPIQTGGGFNRMKN